MSVLLLRLAGPMQSWGTQSRFSMRDTGLEPSKSGVIGLICAALGRSRDQPVDDLATLEMGVRVDREGRMGRDYQTAMQVVRADGKGTGTVISNRYYLADADFLVGLEGDLSLLTTIYESLAAPRWPLYLGRKAFVPSLPVGITLPVEGGLLATLKRYPWLKGNRRDKPQEERLRLVIETPFGEGTDVRYDVPISFAERTFTLRHVRTEFVSVPSLEEGPCCT